MAAALVSNELVAIVVLASMLAGMLAGRFTIFA